MTQADQMQLSVFSLYHFLEQINAHLRRLHAVSYLLVGFEECHVEYIRTSDAEEVGELVGHLVEEARGITERFEKAVDIVHEKVKEG